MASQEQHVKQQMQIVVSSGVRTSEMVAALHRNVCSLREHKHQAERDSERLFAALCKLQGLAFVTHSTCTRLVSHTSHGEGREDECGDDGGSRGCGVVSEDGERGGDKDKSAIAMTLVSSERAAAGLSKSIATLRCPVFLAQLLHAARACDSSGATEGRTCTRETGAGGREETGEGGRQETGEGGREENGERDEGAQDSTGIGEDGEEDEAEDWESICTGELVVAERLRGDEGRGIDVGDDELRHGQTDVEAQGTKSPPHRWISLLNSPLPSGEESCNARNTAETADDHSSPMAVSRRLPSLSPSFALSPSPGSEKAGHGNGACRDGSGVCGREDDVEGTAGAAGFVPVHSLKLLRISDAVETGLFAQAGVRGDGGGSDEGGDSCAHAVESESAEIPGNADHDPADEVGDEDRREDAGEEERETDREALLRLEEERERVEWERMEREWERRREREWMREQEEERDGEKERVRDLEVELEITAVRHLLALLEERHDSRAACAGGLCGSEAEGSTRQEGGQASGAFLSKNVPWLVRVGVNIHTYIHTYMHACIHACMHACIHAYIHTYMHTYMHT